MLDINEPNAQDDHMLMPPARDSDGAGGHVAVNLAADSTEMSEKAPLCSGKESLV